MNPTDWLSTAQRLQALAHNGLTYYQNEYDRERYEEIYSISMLIFANLSTVPVDTVIRLLPTEVGYQTPKVDVRAFVLNESNQILMVQEKIDQNRWSLPGGWADVGYSPFEVAQKEVKEETGLDVEALRLLAVFDKSKHNHPPQLWYVYKFFILCQAVGGKVQSETMETTNSTWINRTDLQNLSLSTERVTLSQLETIFQLATNPLSITLCD